MAGCIDRWMDKGPRNGFQSGGGGGADHMIFFFCGEGCGCARSAHHEHAAQSPFFQGPLKGPGSDIERILSRISNKFVRNNLEYMSK